MGFRNRGNCDWLLNNNTGVGTRTTHGGGASDHAFFPSGARASGSYQISVGLHNGTLGAGANYSVVQEGSVSFVAGVSSTLRTIGTNATVTINSGASATFATGLIISLNSGNSYFRNNGTTFLTINSGVSQGATGRNIVVDGSGSGGTKFNGAVSLAGSTFTVNTSGSGNVTILANASGNMINGTTVSSGTLLVTNTSGSGTGGGAVSVASTGTLGGTLALWRMLAMDAGQRTGKLRQAVAQK